MEKSKLYKKQRRKEALLLAKEPQFVQFQRDCSVHVLVSNAGIVNGLSRAAVQILLPSTIHIFMPADKDYCYVTFEDVAAAEEAVRDRNGVCVQSMKTLWNLLPVSLQTGPPLHVFLSYIARLPPCAAHVRENSREQEQVNGRHLQLPPGLVVVEEFISCEEEASLTSWLMEEYSHEDMVEVLKQREVRHYGYRFDYSSNSVDHTSPLPGGMPPQLTEMISKMKAAGLVHHWLDQVTVNRYPPGAGEREGGGTLEGLLPS